MAGPSTSCSAGVEMGQIHHWDTAAGMEPSHHPIIPSTPPHYPTPSSHYPIHPISPLSHYPITPLSHDPMIPLLPYCISPLPHCPMIPLPHYPTIPRHSSPSPRGPRVPRCPLPRPGDLTCCPLPVGPCPDGELQPGDRERNPTGSEGSQEHPQPGLSPVPCHLCHLSHLSNAMDPTFGIWREQGQPKPSSQGSPPPTRVT